MYEKHFKEEELLGEGGYGSVHKVRHLTDKKIYAIKKVRIDERKKS
jgi:serine/threonine protein kinase